MQETGSTWVGATARQIARAVRRGDTSATSVVADHLDRIRADDPVLGAFRTVRAGEALAEAEQVDEQEDLANLPLAGVPIAVKENAAVAGLATANGSVAASTPLAGEDHEVVRRLRGAGAVVVGTTRMPELGLWPFTDDPTGTTRNPWDLERTPGGSSGGAAAAVAAGLVPIAHGNDGLGSVRIPAACCGLVGIKPGRGVVPCGLGADGWFGLAENGILGTTVADVATAFAVLAGRQPERLLEPSRLRLAVSSRSPVGGVRVDQPNRDAFSSAVRLLTDMGHEAVPADPRYSTGLGLRGVATWLAAAYRDAEAAGLDRSRLQRRTRRHIALGGWVWRRGYVRQSDRDDWRAQCLRFFTEGDVDLLLTPALAGPPPKAEEWWRRGWATNVTTAVRFAPFAAPWNLAGLPAVVVPMGTRPDGLPVSVQLVGPPGAELLLLAVAGQLELAAPWRRHAPGWPRPAVDARAVGPAPAP